MDDAVLDGAANGRREQTKAQNRQAILDAARRVFATLGYDSTTVRDIIRGTDLASGTFYNYFKSKEEVFDALQDDGARRFRPLLRAASAGATSFEDFIRRSLVAYFKFIAEESDRSVLVEGPFRHDTPEMKAVFDEVRAQLEAAMRNGAAPRVDADYLAAASIGLAREVGARMMQRSPPDVEGAAAFCIGLLLGGLPSLPRIAPHMGDTQ